MFARPKYALHGAPQRLPRPATTAAALYSVPRPSGGYDYYRAPLGTAPPQNDDFPVPTVAHPNEIGVSSLTLGRPLPPGSVRIGSGEEAKGSITPMPGVNAEGALVSGLGAAPSGVLGALGHLGNEVIEAVVPAAATTVSGAAAQTLVAVAVAAGLITAVAVYHQRKD